MKTRHLALIASLFVSAACGPAVAEDSDASSTSEAGTQGEGEDSGSTGGPAAGASTSSTTTFDNGSSSSGLESSSTSTTTSDESSSTGTAVECGSPLLDADDRLQIANAPMRGNPDALVTLVVWTGYADPFSASLQPTLAALASGPSGDELRIVSKQMPLDFQDPDGRLARAGLAADALGVYWPFHDAMFAAEEDLEPEVVDEIAASVGLDLKTFHATMRSPEVAARLAEDTALFAAVGASGTPSTIINGELFVGAQPLGGFEAVVASQRAAMESLIDAGIPACIAFGQRLDTQLP